MRRIKTGDDDDPSTKGISGKYNQEIDYPDHRVIWKDESVGVPKENWAQLIEGLVKGDLSPPMLKSVEAALGDAKSFSRKTQLRLG